MKIGDEVERNVTVVPVPLDELTCALCGADQKVFGFVDRDRIRYVPGKIVVDVERCFKAVSVAPRDNAPVVVFKVDATVLAKLLGDEDPDGPASRLPGSRAGPAAARGPEQNPPVLPVVRADLNERPIVAADDSHLRTLNKTSKHGIFCGHLWCFVGTDGVVGGPEAVAYGYAPTWEAEKIADCFSAIDGSIQCDRYAGYSAEVEAGEMRAPVPEDRRLGCPMHLRSSSKQTWRRPRSTR